MNSSFNSQQEIWQYLSIPGNKVQGLNAVIYEIQKDSLVCRLPGNTNEVSKENFNNYQNFDKLEELPWYDSIPEEGIWCKIWDNPGRIFFIYKVIKYNPLNEFYPFATEYHNWEHAKPFSKELNDLLNKELQNLI